MVRFWVYKFFVDWYYLGLGVGVYLSWGYVCFFGKGVVLCKG